MPESLATRIGFALRLAFAAICGIGFATGTQALPVFARQTGQNCVACHAGGQFPELTPYGRKFKLTGYTMGERPRIPLAAMAVVSVAKVDSHRGSADPATDFPHDGNGELTTYSLFCCGKLTDNIGLFAQWTNDRFDHLSDSGHWVAHSHPDQVDLRWADRFIDLHSDLIVGASLNNNPGVTDVWNTHNSAFTPVPTYVPVSNALATTVPFDVPVAPIDQSLGANSAGITVYGYWNDLVYLELGAYTSARRLFPAFDQHVGDPFTRPKGVNPYWRLALNHDWGAHSAMIGLHGLEVETLSDPTQGSSPTARFRDIGVDGQYQYLLDPHAVTAMFSYTHETQRYAAALWDPNDPGYAGAFTGPRNSLDYLRLKATYSYQARYGAALAYTRVKGSADALAYPVSPTGRPDSQLWVPELFYLPYQYTRIGLQYYKWTRFNGARQEYDPVDFPGRNARDNNALFLYVWAAY
jgi:hypothetical protein